MALLLLDEDPWLLEHDSCEKLQRDIMELLDRRTKHPRTSDHYSQLSVTIRQRLKQFNNEVSQLNQKLDNASRSGAITGDESERRVRQIEQLHSKGVRMQGMFDNQGFSQYNEDRASLIGNSPGFGEEQREESVEEIMAQQSRMLGEQDQGLENLSQIISRQKNIAQVISNEVDFHNEIIDDLGTRMDRTDARVRGETDHIGVVTTKDKTCAYWVVIILLFISIIIVAAI